MKMSINSIATKHNGETAKIFHDLKHVMADDDVVVLYGAVGTCVADRRKNIDWTMNYAAYHVFPKREHYNFLIVEKEDGNEYYCNLASRPTLADDAVHYVDYDIDVVLSPGGTIAVHDLDQFDERIALWGYPDDLVAQMRATQRRIEQALADRSGWFGFSFYRYLAAVQICMCD